MLALFSLACDSTLDKLGSVPVGATRAQVIEILGPPTAEEDLPGGARALPDGCASHVVYEDRYLNPFMRAVDERVRTCGGTWVHVCFDEDGHSKSGLRFSMINC